MKLRAYKDFCIGFRWLPYVVRREPLLVSWLGKSIGMVK